MRAGTGRGRGWMVVLGLWACSQPASRAAEPAEAAEVAGPSAAEGAVPETVPAVAGTEAAEAAMPETVPAVAGTEAAEEPRASEPEVAEVKAAGVGEPCRNGQRLDSGCVCRPGGACFDICCGPLQDCAHPRRPGGRSACVLRMPPRTDPAPPRACRDGELLADGCTCNGQVCADICCVGSACSHGPGGSKCVSLPKRKK
ncbi:MAG TPA: hypothetical protein VIK91_03400 [Nannocystis sp.]